MTAATRELAPREFGAGGRVGGERGAGPGHRQGCPASDAHGAFTQTLPSGLCFLKRTMDGVMGKNYSQRKRRRGGGRPRGPCGGQEGLGSEDWVGNSENLLNKVKMLFKRLVRLMLRKGVERVRAMTCVDFGGWVPG